MPFLRDLHRALRAEEFSALPLSSDQKQALVDQQFSLQHRSYVASFRQADFLIVERDGAAIGRLYIDRTRDAWHIIEICLRPERRNAGLGSAIVEAIQNQATAAGAGGITLNVACANVGARRFYRQLGFRETARDGAYAQMEWISAGTACRP